MSLEIEIKDFLFKKYFKYHFSGSQFDFIEIEEAPYFQSESGENESYVTIMSEYFFHPISPLPQFIFDLFKTPLFLAVEDSRDYLVKGLLEHEINPNSGFFFKPLQLAALRNDPEIIKLLLVGNAHPDQSYFLNALQISVRKGHQEATQELLKGGANPNICWPFNPLNHVLKNNDIELAMLLEQYGAEHNLCPFMKTYNELDYNQMPDIGHEINDLHNDTLDLF